MALAVDATASTQSLVNQTAGGTTTYAHTVAGANRLLAVAVSAWNNGGTGTGCSGVTYNGVAMTLIGSSLTAGGAFYTEMWYLIAPATGTNNIVATVSGKTDKLGLVSLSLTGADQTSPVDAYDTMTSITGTYTKAITTTVANDIMLDITSHLSANTASSGSGTSILNSGTGGVGVASQYATAALAGTNAMTWTYPDIGDTGTYFIAAFKESGGAPPAGATNLFFF